MRSKKREITIPLMGGLGNQLFQFAAGNFVQKYHSRFPKFFIGSLSSSKNTPRVFMLGDLLDSDKKSQRKRIYFAACRVLSLIKPAIWVSERGFEDFPISRIANNTKVLLGYFQRSIYVDSVAPEILQSFSNSVTFKDLLQSPSKNNISVHIRFGDYMTNPQTKSVHGLTAMSYYVNAVNTLQITHEYDKIVVYSDDPDLAYDEFCSALGSSKVPIVLSNNSSEYEDLSNMASSKGIVISNSTFPWWAAWIGTQLHDCNVVAPRPWFATPSAADNNLLPDGWTVLDRELQP